MTTTLGERPSAPAPTHGGGPARRAVVRWAWRLYRREWRRQALVLALLIVAVAATVVGLGAVTNAVVSKADPTFGTANAIVTLPGSDPDLSGDIAALRNQFGLVEPIARQSVPIPGSVANLDVRAEDPNGPFGHVMVRLAAGRYPTGRNEVALTADAAKTFGLRVGDTWNANGRALRVVGLVENPLNLLDQFALVAPGQASPATSVSVLINASMHALDSFRLPSHTGMSIAARTTTGSAVAAAIVLVFSALGLLFVGLMAVAGFAVMAHRRQRSLGMLASLGATDRRLRLVVLANGAAVGVTAAIVGAAVGLAGWFAFAPVLGSITERRVDRFALPWWAVGAAMGLTFVTAIAAAWWPARAVARMSSVAALSGRPARPQPPHRFAALGGVLLAGGIVLLAFADRHRAGFIIGGTLATAIGLLFLAPLAIRLLAGLARYSTIAVTLALRDLARYQARSGAALGAITLAIGIAATIAISASTAEKPTTAGNLATDQLVMHVSRGAALDAVPSLSPAQLRAATSAVQQLAATLHASTLELDEAHNLQGGTVALSGTGGPVAVSPDRSPTAGQPGGYLTPVLAKVARLAHGEQITEPVRLYVATPAVLARYGIATSQVPSDADIISARTDLGGLQLFNPMTPGPNATAKQRTSRGNEVSVPRIHVTSQLPAYSSAANTLLTPHAMQALGLASLPSGWLLQTSHPLTKAQIDLATKAAASAGLYVETRRLQKSLAPLRNGATAAGILLALGVLAMTVGLIRSETSGELRTLAATGASSRTRRALTGATAGALAFLGAFLGTAGAYVAVVAWHRSHLTVLGHVPVVNLVVILLGLPIIATACGWLLAGREPTGIARQPLE